MSATTDREPSSVCRDGLVAEPLTVDELRGIRRAFPFYDSTDLIPRLVATVDALAGGEQS